MADFPGGVATQHITVGVPQLIPELEMAGQYVAATGAWPVANLAMFIPFPLSAPYLATQMFVVNGGTVSGNIDVGIYDSQGNRVVSIGSTTHAGTSAIQTFDITDTLLNPGMYYLACALDNTTGIVHNYGATSNTPWLRAFGCLQTATAFALPSSVTFAAYAQAFIPSVHVTGSAVI